MFSASTTYEKQLRIEKTRLSHQVWSHGGSTFKKKKRTLNGHFSRPAETDPYGFLIMEIRINYFCVAELFITQRMCNKDVIGAFCSKYFLITCASPPMCMSAGIFNNNMLASQYGPTSKFTILNIFALFSKFASF